MPLCYCLKLSFSWLFFWFDDFQVLISHVDFGRLGSNVKLSWKLGSVIKLDSGGYSLTYETPEGLVSLLSKSVVFTIPSHIASTLLQPLSVCFILEDFTVFQINPFCCCLLVNNHNWIVAKFFPC
jgi:hypothetical protein